MVKFTVSSCFIEIEQVSHKNFDSLSCTISTNSKILTVKTKRILFLSVHSVVKLVAEEARKSFVLRKNHNLERKMDEIGKYKERNQQNCFDDAANETLVESAAKFHRNSH